MTQEHFLLQPAHQAIQDESARLFFQPYEDLQNQWPWQDPVKHWVEHILSFAQKPALMSVFLDPIPEGGGKLYFRVDGRVLPGSSFTAEQYHHLVAAIQARIVFPQSVVGSLLQEGFIPSESGQKHWVGILKTVTGVQITFCFARGSLPSNPLEDWPDQARGVVEQMKQHPNGLMLFCHRGWSLSQQDTLFKVFSSLLQTHSEARIGCITEGLQTLPAYDNMTQLCVDGSPQSWEQASHTLVAQDIDLVLMRGRNEKEVVTQAILTALEDRMVLVDVSHFSVLNTLTWLFTELPLSASQIASVLLGVVGSYPGLRRVCPHCVTQQAPDDALRLLFQKQGFSSIPEGNWVQGQGCSECFGRGYLHRPCLTVVEAVYLDQSLARLCETSPNPDQIRSALAETGFRTYFEQALEFAQQGMTTLQEAIRIGVARRSEL